MTLTYFITEDLEATAGVGINELAEVRERATKALVKSLGTEIKTSVISLEKGREFFEEARTTDEFRIAADGGIYVENPDISIESTRMYRDEATILGDKKSYQILSRDGNPLETQKVLSIPDEKRGNVGLYDDGIFSGDTLRAILRQLPNGVTKYKINILLNFSGTNTIGNVPINAYYSGDCLDWIDERDFYYGVKNSGASINPNGVVSGVPYISSPEMVHMKASIPRYASKEFCLTMLSVNQDLWRIIDENRTLQDVPRLRYLLDRYVGTMPIQDLLEAEQQRITNNF